MPAISPSAPSHLRLAIVGTSGAGKTTLAQKLAEQHNLDHIELDELYWGPNWTPRHKPTVIADLEARLAGDNWAVTGNYSEFRPRVLARATHIVWLNYSAWRIGTQLVPRTCGRVFLRKRVCGNNIETFRHAFASQDSILVWAATTFRRNRVTYRNLFESPDYPDLKRVELRSRKATNQWLQSLPNGTT